MDTVSETEVVEMECVPEEASTIPSETEGTGNAMRKKNNCHLLPVRLRCML